MRAAVGWFTIVWLTAAWAQSGDPLTREGRFWTAISSGTAAVDPQGALRVSARGDISVRGEVRRDVAYSLKKRVRADAEAAARSLLEAVSLAAQRRGRWTELVLSLPGSALESELRLRVPETLQELVLVSQGGNLDVENLRGGLRVQTGGGHVRLDGIRGPVTVRTAGGNVRLGRIGGPVRCAAEGGSIFADWLQRQADLTTAGGEVVVARADGVLRAVSGGGNIRIQRARAVTAASAGGMIDVLAAQGPVQAETAAGTVRVRHARDLRVHAGAGAVELEAVSGALQVSTGRGNILAVLSEPLQNSFLSTAAGDITVLVPSNLAVTVEAVNTAVGSGKILSEFPQIQVRPAARGLEARGALNGGGPQLALTASGGTIYLRKKEQ